MGNFIIYTKTGCPYCQKAMEDYRGRGVSFTEINTDTDEAAKKLIKEKYGAAKVPVIVEDEKLVSIGFNGGG